MKIMTMKKNDVESDDILYNIKECSCVVEDKNSSVLQSDNFL